MLPIDPILAYFGPETAFPVASVIAGIVGFFLMLGKNTFKYVRMWCKSLFKRPQS